MNAAKQRFANINTVLRQYKAAQRAYRPVFRVVKQSLLVGAERCWYCLLANISRWVRDVNARGRAASAISALK
jgi:hypothetical protein